MRPFNKNIQPFVLLSSFLLSPGLQAAQLGKLEVLSSSAEPFLAQVQVQTIRPEERKGLQARLASAEAFKAARLTMDPRLASLRFEIKAGVTAETAVIHISSDKPLGQEFLDALIELNWAGGRVAREYTFTPAEDKKQPPKTDPLSEIVPPQIKASKAQSTQQALVEAAPVASLQQLSNGVPEIHSVSKGQTLSGLAVKLTGQGVNLNQAMAAIYEANREAFMNNSVHQLRAGARLVIPNKEALRARTHKEALVVLAKNDDRNVYSLYARRMGLFSIADQSKLPPSTQASGQLDSDMKSQPTASSELDKLKIAPTSMMKSDAAAEELTAKNKALVEANERITLLEKNVSDLQKLLDMQKDMAEPAATEETNSVPSDAELPKNDNVKPVAVSSEVLSTSEAKAPEESAKPEDKPADHDGVLLPWLLSGAGAIVLAVVGLFVWRARSRKNQDAHLVMQQEPSFDALIPEDNLKSEVPERSLPQEDAPQKLDVLASDSFDLDHLLARDEVSEPPRVTESNERSESVENILDQLDVQDERGSMVVDQSPTMDMALDFPDELAVEPAKNSILDDLDMLSMGAVSAQAELQSMREHLSSDALVPEETEDAFESSRPELDVDVPEPSSEPVDEAVWQEVATKLDLAGAYVEIGDADGARELLNEIVKKGDSEQVGKAKALLETLG